MPESTLLQADKRNEIRCKWPLQRRCAAVAKELQNDKSLTARSAKIDLQAGGIFIASVRRVALRKVD